MAVKVNDEVRTRDGFKLGYARRWHFRPDEDVDPEVLLFAAYLQVENFELGDTFFVPDVYVVGQDDHGDFVLIDATMKQVEQWTWTRMPDFMIRNQGREVLLPAEAALNS
jgi:hypothetical protein